MRGRGQVSNEEWAVLEPLLRFRQRPDGRGRPPQDTRAVLKWGIVDSAHGSAVAGTAQEVSSLSDLSPARWVRSGQLNKALRALARELHGHGLLPLEEGLLDGTFASAKKGAWPWGRPSVARGRK